MTRAAQEPDVTIVTVCFRNPLELEVTLRTVAPLAGQGMESIVVDGSPDDSCTKTVSRFPFVRYLHGPDRGKYDAMNKGIAIARGQAIIFMNSGDQFQDPAAFAAMVNHHRAMLGSHVIYGDCVKLVGGRSIAVPAPAIAAETLRTGVLPSHQSILVPAHWLRAHPFDAALDFAADTKSLKAAFRSLPRFYVPEPIAAFAFGGISASPGPWRRLIRQFRELVAVHELDRIEAVRLATLLLRRKLVHLVIGENGLQRAQARRLEAKLRRGVERAE